MSVAADELASAPEWMQTVLQEIPKRADRPISLPSMCVDAHFTKPQFLQDTFHVVLQRRLGHGTSGLVLGASIYGDSVNVVSHALKVYESRRSVEAELAMHLRVGRGAPGEQFALPVAFGSFDFAGGRYWGLLFPRLSALTPKLIAATKGRARMFLCTELLEAVAFLHALSLAHCDLKTDNILVKSDEAATLVLGDLGSGRDFANCEDVHLAVYRGTPVYSSPAAVHVWKWNNEEDSAAPTYNAFVQDLWGAVLIIMELATGVPVDVDVSSAVAVRKSVSQWRSGNDRSRSLDRFVANAVAVLDGAEASHLVNHNLSVGILRCFNAVDADAFLVHDDNLELKLGGRVAALTAEVSHLRQTLARVTRSSVAQPTSPNGRPPLARVSPRVGNVQCAREKPKAAVPKAAVPKAAVPKAAVPKAAVPKAAVPKAAVPKAAVPKAAVPKAAVPKAAVPKAAVPKGAVPKAAVPKAAVPKAALPKAAVPKAAVPKAAVSKLVP